MIDIFNKLKNEFEDWIKSNTQKITSYELFQDPWTFVSGDIYVTTDLQYIIFNSPILIFAGITTQTAGYPVYSLCDYVVYSTNQHEIFKRYVNRRIKNHKQKKGN